MGYISRPQRLWWRRTLFQIHLWVGVILGLYMVVIGLTGSLLVFKDELATLTYPSLMRTDAHDPASAVDLPQFVANAHKAFPEHKLVSAFVPGVYGGSFFAYMEGAGGSGLYVFGDSRGDILGSLDVEKIWINWVADLHFRLLAGQTGFIVNGAGAAFLVLLCLTGMVLWWPGIRTWPRALAVNFRKSWKRVNFDLHSAVGFWTLSLVSMWAISGVYFVWPRTVEHVVNWISPVEAGVEPEFSIVRDPQAPLADLRGILARSQYASPETRLAGFYLPSGGKTAMVVYQTRRGIRNFSETDHVYFHPTTGALLGVWHAGVNPTLGSKLVYWLGPLHSGFYWGMGIKFLWAVLGLSLPVLTVTGALMYWNRSLAKLWSRLRSRGDMQSSASHAQARPAE